MRTLRIDGDIVIAGNHTYQELDLFIVRLRWARHQREGKVWLSAACNARRQRRGLLCHLSRAYYKHRNRLHALIGWECRVRCCVTSHQFHSCLTNIGGWRLATCRKSKSLHLVAGGCSFTASSGNHKQHEGRAHTE